MIAIDRVSAAAGGWDVLVTITSPALLRLALMLTGNVHDAEDLLQVTFARACRHGDRIAAMAAPAAYLRKVMVNAHTSGRRVRRVWTRPLEESVEPVALDSLAVDERDEVWRWLATFRGSSGRCLCCGSMRICLTRRSLA